MKTDLAGPDLAALHSGMAAGAIDPMRHLVRRIASGEVQLLRDVRLRALEESPSAFSSTFTAEAGRPATTWEDVADRRAHGADQTTFLAVGDGQCVGLVSAGHPHEHPGAELFSMWVSPQVRRVGIGSRLVGAVMDWARAAGDDSLWLWVTQDNAAAIRFYERRGFVATGARKPLASLPDKEVIRMVLPLLEPPRGTDD
jgi:ribosomal protein S18 acetylase RimI-like enzyme